MGMNLHIENTSCKYINVLLSRHFDFLSQCIYYMTGKGFTHVSIGLEEDIYYSFNGKGFRIEKPGKWREKDKRIITMAYRIEVEEMTYQKVKNYIEEIKNNQMLYKYNLLGVILSILHIPYHTKYKYFCSQFVAEALKQSEILDIGVPEFMILPNSFYRIMENHQFTKIAFCQI